MATKSPRYRILIVLLMLLAGLAIAYVALFDGRRTPETAEAPALGTDAPERQEAKPLPPRAPESVPVRSKPSLNVPVRPRPPVEPAGLREPQGPSEPAASAVTHTPAFSSERVSFAVEVKNDVIPYRVFGLFLMPEETVELEAVFLQRPNQARFVSEVGDLELLEPTKWLWTAPKEPGVYPLRITDTAADETITLNVFVMQPFDYRDDALNGYRIGYYQQKPLRGNPVYNPPRGFVEVTLDNRDVPVSPHFTLGQFLCKQPDGPPQYLILRERLLLKLEMILQEVNELGVTAHTLHVMSGYRTPHYNQSIGNRTRYSRHLYGGAADIFVDTDEDGYMDDLDGDGRTTTDDARMLARIVETQTDEAWYQPFLGGLGIYSPKPHRGPFIHVDVRGHRVRW